MYIVGYVLMAGRFLMLCIVWRVIYLYNMNWGTFFGVDGEQQGLLAAFYLLQAFSIPIAIEKVIWGTAYDMLRKSFFISQIVNMLSLQGFSHMAQQNESINEETRVFPTIDVSSRESIEAWNQLRRVALDFGRVYEYTGKGVITAIAVIASLETLFSGVSFVLGLTQAIMWFTLPLPFDFLAFTAYLRLTVGSAANLNASFDESLRSWLAVKNILKDVHLNVENFLSAALVGNDTEYAMLPVALVELLQDKSNRKTLGKDEIRTLCDDSIQEIDKVVDNLEHEKELQPYKVLGLTVTWALIGEWLVAALTIIITTIINALQEASKEK
jgi:hypothetical protein